MADLKLSNVNKTFGKVEVIPGIDLHVKSGEFVVFVGPSGCGKSTLLRLIAGLEEITSGNLEIDGQDMTDALPSHRGVAMVFQSYALYPHMTVYQNMAFGLKLEKTSKEELDKRVRDAARILQIDGLFERLPKQLSGGQRQRVAIGRAIVRDPKLFLFDEPLSNLDAALRTQTRIEIAQLHESLPGTTMIYVTHDQVEAMTLADRIVVLNGGRVEQVGTPLELYNAPANQFVAGFIGSPKMNFIAGPIAKQQKCASLGIRPEHISVVEGEAEMSGIVRFVEQLGADTFVHVEVENAGVIQARNSGQIATSIGDKVSLKVEPGSLHKFDKQGKPVSA